MEDSIGYDRSVKYARLNCGRLINVMMKRGDSAEDVIEQLHRPGVPRRLAFTDAYLATRGPNDE